MLAGMAKDSDLSNSSNSVFFKNLLFQQIKSWVHVCFSIICRFHEIYTYILNHLTLAQESLQVIVKNETLDGVLVPLNRLVKTVKPQNTY